MAHFLFLIYSIPNGNIIYDEVSKLLPTYFMCFKLLTKQNSFYNEAIGLIFFKWGIDIETQSLISVGQQGSVYIFIPENGLLSGRTGQPGGEGESGSNQSRAWWLPWRALLFLQIKHSVSWKTLLTNLCTYFFWDWCFWKESTKWQCLRTAVLAGYSWPS